MNRDNIKSKWIGSLVKWCTMLLTEKTKGKSSATNHNQSLYMVLLSVLLESELFWHWRCSKFELYHVHTIVLLFRTYWNVVDGIHEIKLLFMSQYISVRGVHSDYWMQIPEWTFLWFWIVFSSISHWNVWHMLDGSDSILSWNETFKFSSKITLFETTNWFLSVWLSSKNTSILPDRFDQIQNKT